MMPDLAATIQRDRKWAGTMQKITWDAKPRAFWRSFEETACRTRASADFGTALLF